MGVRAPPGTRLVAVLQRQVLHEQALGSAPVLFRASERIVMGSMGR